MEERVSPRVQRLASAQLSASRRVTQEPTFAQDRLWPCSLLAVSLIVMLPTRFRHLNLQTRRHKAAAQIWFVTSGLVRRSVESSALPGTQPVIRSNPNFESLFFQV